MRNADTSASILPDETDPIVHAGGKGREPRSAACRRSRQKGREQLLAHIAPRKGSTTAELSASLRDVATAGLPDRGHRIEALRGAAELLEELAKQLRQASI